MKWGLSNKINLLKKQNCIRWRFFREDNFLKNWFFFLLGINLTIFVKTKLKKKLKKFYWGEKYELRIYILRMLRYFYWKKRNRFLQCFLCLLFSHSFSTLCFHISSSQLSCYFYAFPLLDLDSLSHALSLSDKILGSNLSNVCVVDLRGMLVYRDSGAIRPFSLTHQQ